MNRRDRRRIRALQAKGAQIDSGPAPKNQEPKLRIGPRSTNPRALLRGTALASTLLLGTFAAPAPAAAQVPCPPGTFPPPGPISIDGAVGDINCVNVFDRNDGGTGTVIEVRTTNGSVELDNRGRLVAIDPNAARGINARAQTFLSIFNSGDIIAVAGDQSAFGIDASAETTLSIDTRGSILATSDTADAFGINASGFSTYHRIVSSGAITVAAGRNTFGIFASTTVGSQYINSSSVITSTADGFATGIRAEAGTTQRIVSSGDIRAIAQTESARGINATSGDSQSIFSSGAIVATTYGAGANAYGINAESGGVSTIVNRGAVTATANGSNSSGYGIRVKTPQANSPITIDNSGNLFVTATNEAYGVRTETEQFFSDITITNTAQVTVRAESASGEARGLFARTSGRVSRIDIENSGPIDVTADFAATGILAFTLRADNGGRSPITIRNSGDITARALNADYSFAYGVNATTLDSESFISIQNAAHVDAKAATQAIAIRARTGTNPPPTTPITNSPISIENSGELRAEAAKTNDPLLIPDNLAIGIFAETFAQNSAITIANSGSIYATGGSDNKGVYVHSLYNNPTTITNTGDISAQSYRAIDVKGAGTAGIFNAGTITGFVDLTDQSDRFFNQAGGVFEAKRTSVFGDGSDLFVNEAGGTVQAATDVSQSETTRFVGLETFRNRGLISMVDGRAGDKFILSNTVDGTDLDFEAGPGSTLALDVFLDGPASPADNFFIQGNVSGQTAVVVNNTNVGPGTFNPQGIPVIFVDGNTPSALDFQLQDGPIDTGFFDYDLFFVPTNSGFWELRSFTGAGAFLLPQLVTAAQDIWHQGSNAWFDRTADLRVLLAGGLAPTAYNPVGSKSFEAAGPYPLTPAVWARGSGGWLDRDDSAKTRAHGRNYSFDLDRELTTLDFQVGVDLGKRDVMNEGDALVFGMLGGFVYGGLDYDAIPRSFDFSGGQVGAYATYLNGGLFVDTLLNVHLYELSTATRGFPSSLDANTVGLRTDAGYRFGSFTGGAFLEPLATIEVLWADIDGFSLGGNTVSFDDDANVRGRLGLRAGTTMEAWEGTLMEPFVIGSVWGNLSDDNSATLVSNGRTFSFQDDLEDVWGEISGGVNFFNFSQTTAVFAKVDVTVGNDISGVGGKAGMRVNW